MTATAAQEPRPVPPPPPPGRRPVPSRPVDNRPPTSGELTPEQRSLRARIAANTRWSQTTDRTAATAAARAAFADRWERLVDPDGRMSPSARRAAAENARRAHFQRMALKSAQARRRSA